MSREEREERETGRERHPHNMVTVMSKFADDHLTLLRNTSALVAVTGVVVIFRSIRLLTKFQTASEIPARFIARNVSLRGKVRSVTERGLEVDHVPIYVPFLSPLFYKHQGRITSPLLVRLAGVDLTPEGQTWLQQNLSPPQTVWIKLIGREDDVLFCLVSQKNTVSLWRLSVNEQLLRLGLARTAPLRSLQQDYSSYSGFLWRLHRRLHRAEVTADRKGRGLWRKDPALARASAAFWDSPIVRLFRRIFRRT